MTFSDIFKSSFLENVTSVSVLDMALALGLSFAIGLFIFLIYRKTYAGVMYSASFGVTLVGLTLLSRMEEAEDTLQKVDFPLSDTVSEAAAPFRTLARQQEKLFTLSIQPLLTLRGDAKAIRQLTELLLDNALKYSPPGGAIDLTLSRQGRTATLTVTNATGTDIDPDQPPRLFDRFYRADASRNSETGGHGIGLSVAKAIVTAHGGSIRAISDGPRTFRIRASLPY